MGLLTRENPNASTRSLLIHTVIGGIVGVLAGVGVVMFGHVQGRYAVALIGLISIVGAGIAGVMEWQLDDGPDAVTEDQEPLNPIDE